MIDQTIIRKIQALLALAEGKTSLEESATAAGLAQALLTKYRLAMSDVQVGAETVDYEGQPIAQCGKRITHWKGIIVAAVCKANGCYGFWTYVPSAQGMGFRVIGKPSDVQICAYFYNYLEREIERLCLAAVRRGRCEVIDPGDGWDPGIPSDKGATTSFKVGAATAVAIRLQESARAETAKAGTSAIVRVERDALALQRECRQRFNIRSTQASRPSDGGAYGAGKRAGEGITLNRGLGGRPVRLLGT